MTTRTSWKKLALEGARALDDLLVIGATYRDDYACVDGALSHLERVRALVPDYPMTLGVVLAIKQTKEGRKS